MFYDEDMMKFIKLSNSQIAYRCVGDGPDLVFVHGWPVDSRTYRHVVPTLSKHFRCHLFDLPGAGATVWNKESQINFAGHCQTLRQVIDRLRLSEYALCAHDSGGIYARHLAARNPEKVRGMVLINTDIPHVQTYPLKMLVFSANLPGSNKLMPALLRTKAFRHSSLFGKAMFYSLAKFDGEFGELYVRPLYNNKAVFDGQMQLIYSWDWSFLDNLSQIHPQIKAPVQFIWGRDDIIFPLKYARKMIEEFGGPTELKVIEESGLYVQEEQPEQLLHHALPFLQSCF